jgi:signal transduction histidine kinase
VEDQSALRPLLKRANKFGSKIQVWLNAGKDAQLSAQISIRSLVKHGSNRATIGMVVTDLTDARRSEEMLRALARRVVEVQEAERARVALELHDNITQLLCAVVFRSSVLAENLSSHDGPAKSEATNLCAMLGQTAEEVERISGNLRPSVLEHMGLVTVLRSTCAEFAVRTGVLVKLSCVPLAARLPVDAELALYRILQQALANVEIHARAHHVVVDLTLQGAFARLTIKDDGLGFDVEKQAAGKKRKDGLGLLSMRERASYVGGTFTIKSARRSGTEIEVLIPVGAKVTAID